MKLHEFKAKYLSMLALYKPSSQKEKELREKIIVKLNYMRATDLVSLTYMLYLIVEHEESISEKFREICRKMIEDAGKIVLQDHS